MIKVGVIGAAGRMGSEVCGAVAADEELELVARVAHADSLASLGDAEVAVEFTTPDAVKNNVAWCLEHGIHTVVGTTGLGDDDLADIERLADKNGVRAFVAPNFAIGAVLMMQFAARAAPHFDAAEIIERHHDKKLDAPSGTALRTAAQMNAARSALWNAPARGRESLAGARGGSSSGVSIHSVRLPGSVAHQEVILGSTGETLTIRHDSIDRASFMAGVVLAVKKVAHLDRPLMVGLEHLLDL